MLKSIESIDMTAIPSRVRAAKQIHAFVTPQLSVRHQVDASVNGFSLTSSRWGALDLTVWECARFPYREI